LNPLIPEWDFLIEIRRTLHTLPGVKLVYVNGHQDQKKAYQNLSLMAQLNVDADDMANEYQEEYGRAHPDALMATHTGVFLVFPEGTKTAKYVPDIRCRATQSPLRKYIQRKNNFDNQTMPIVLKH
jgi:hypothetical protein